jgi:hypothetical protein
MIGHEASTLACEYGPQWMNMPNLALRYQVVRSHASVLAHAARGSNGKTGTGQSKPEEFATTLKISAHVGG